MIKQELKDWDNWQKQVLHEEYVEPDLREKKLQEKMDEINKKYSSFRYAR